MSKPTTVQEYLDSLEPARRDVVEKIRESVKKHLPPGYEEGIQYGFIGFFVPHSVYPHGYHCDPKQPVPFVHIANMKGHVGFYPFCIYCDPDLKTWFLDALTERGVKFDAGAGCIRLKKFENLPYELFGELVAKVPVEAFLEIYTSQIPLAKRPKSK